MVGQEMYGRLATFEGHLSKLGRSPDNRVETFNRAVGSYDSRDLPEARKFTEMGISAKKALPRVEQVERATRLIEPQEAVKKTG